MTHICGRSHSHRRYPGTSIAGRSSLIDPTKVLDDEPGEVPPEVMEAVDEMSAPTEQEIAELAYSYWEAREGRGGSAWDDWFRAERELKRRREL